MKINCFLNIIYHFGKTLFILPRFLFTDKRISPLRFLFILLLFSSNYFAQFNSLQGDENLITNHLKELNNKNIALVVNQTSILPNGTSLLDTLISLGENITKIFSLEHGFYGNKNPGEKIENSQTIKSIPVISLYGRKKSPDKTDLQNVDIVIFDIQDVGARFYTYISSLKLIMKSVAENGKSIYVLDRPNPQGGKICGEILDKKFASFVGISPIPVTYGITIGELSLFFRDEIREKSGLLTNLKVIPMFNYNREKPFPDSISNWIPPSPNLRSLNSALLYPGLCFLEATNISEGRGTDFPFEVFGAPFIDSKSLIVKLSREFPALKFSQVNFIPKPVKNYKIKFANKECSGIKIKVIKSNFDPVIFGIKLLRLLKTEYKSKINFNYSWLAKLYGNNNLKNYLNDKLTFNSLAAEIKKDKLKFGKTIKKYLLY